MTIITLSLPSTNPSSFFFHSSPKPFKFNPKSSSSQLSPTNTTSSLPKTSKVIIIGAGLAGLAAATHLNSQNIPFLLLESSNAVGGRVRTDIVDGFLLDRGFQIFITAYPEAQKLLNYQSLNLQKFYSGAKIYYNGQFHTVADPLRHFLDSAKSLTNPIGSIFDKLLIGTTRIGVLTKSDEQILTAEEVPTIDLLKKLGFSDSIIRRFFRPFFGGIFFDPDLETTSRLFDFIFKCLALGENTLPANGISAIPEQLAANLPSDSILLNTKAVSIDFGNSNSPRVTLQNGEILNSELGVIVAVEEPALIKLLPGKINPEESEDELVSKVIQELSDWFGDKMVKKWKHLRTYRIEYAQPNQCPPSNLKKNPRIEPGLYLCGDYLTSATFDGALVSGRRAAESLLLDRAFIANANS
ncbi:hypothetical protein P8452_38681 [Trifolium repens]|nr:hypothetical protein P8452_38681 [Trifolium repens]